MREGRLWREASFDLGAKFWQVNWLYVALLCALAGVGYAALYSAAGGAPEKLKAEPQRNWGTGLGVPGKKVVAPPPLSNTPCWLSAGSARSRCWSSGCSARRRRGRRPAPVADDFTSLPASERA